MFSDYLSGQRKSLDFDTTPTLVTVIALPTTKSIVSVLMDKAFLLKRISALSMRRNGWRRI